MYVTNSRNYDNGTELHCEKAHLRRYHNPVCTHCNNASPALWEYYIQHDSGRVQVIAGIYCSPTCMNEHNKN